MCFKASLAQVPFASFVCTSCYDSFTWSDFVVIFIWRLSEAWHSKRPLLVEAVKFLLDDQNLGIQKALSEVHFLSADSYKVFGQYK